MLDIFTQQNICYLFKIYAKIRHQKFLFFSYFCRDFSDKMNAAICTYRVHLSSPKAFLWGSVHPFNQII